jgi:DAK2 domain fusion protein YloV
MIREFSEVRTVEQPLYDGQTLKLALKSAEAILEKRIDEVNALNVFPVPDGDTGINMYLTLQSANEAVKELSTTSAAEIASKAAMGALLGARGNSGVIFSQIMRGLAKGLEMKDKFSAFDFAQALRNASDNAYKSIAEPVEGTILTVIREASEMAMRQAKRGADLKQTMMAVTSQAKDTVTRTPQMLPALKEAGVVDAGGKGLFYFFLGMKDFIAKKMSQMEVHPASYSKPEMAAAKLSYGFDLQFLIEGHNLPLAEIREKVSSMGESVLVVGDEKLIRVHVHTQQSQAIMDYCSSKGCLKDIINDDMDIQVKTFRNRRNGDKKPARSNGQRHRASRNARAQFSNSAISP